MYAYVGFPLSLAVQTASGTPVGYQWQRNGTNLVVGDGISGSQSNTLTVGPVQYADGGSTFQVLATNANGSVSSTLATLTVLSRLSFNGRGTDWSTQGNVATVPSYVGPNLLRLLDSGKSEASSSFFSYPVYIGGFLATYTSQDVGGGRADGMAFVVQNDARGPAALGGTGGSFGYAGITNSAALEFNIYANNGVGYVLKTNGVTGKPYTSTLPVDVSLGNPVNVTLLYLNGVLTMTLTDSVAQTSYSMSTNVDLPSTVGSEFAYVGFTAGDGSVASTQIVSNFTFVSLPSVSIQAAAPSQVVLAWPTATGGQILQESPSLAPASWSNVNGPVTTGGGFNQVTLPVSGDSSFYRVISGP